VEDQIFEDTLEPRCGVAHRERASGAGKGLFRAKWRAYAPYHPLSWRL